MGNRVKIPVIVERASQDPTELYMYSGLQVFRYYNYIRMIRIREFNTFQQQKPHFQFDYVG